MKFECIIQTLNLQLRSSANLKSFHRKIFTKRYFGDWLDTTSCSFVPLLGLIQESLNLSKPGWRFLLFAARFRGGAPHGTVSDVRWPVRPTKTSDRQSPPEWWKGYLGMKRGAEYRANEHHCITGDFQSCHYQGTISVRIGKMNSEEFVRK